MNVWMVGTDIGQVKRVEAQRYIVSDGYLCFYTDAECVMMFATGKWVYFILDKPMQIPMTPSLWNGDK